MAWWHVIVNAERDLMRALGFNPPPNLVDGDSVPAVAPAAMSLPAHISAPSTQAQSDDPIVGPAFKWLASWAQADRRALLDAQAAVGLDPKIGGLLVVIDHESGGKPTALNPLPAAGLIQLTVGTNLPGFTSADAVREVATWSPEKQAREVITPYYKRMFPHGAPSDQSGVHLLRLNFLPALADRGANFVLGVKEGASGPNGESASDVIAGKLTRGAIYHSNSGFDKSGRGYFTWADVDAQAQAIQARVAPLGWMRVSGAIQAPSDPAMAGTGDPLVALCSDAFAPSRLREMMSVRDIPTHRRHAHTCANCNHVFWHDPDPCVGSEATDASCAAAHVCENCGHVERWVDLALCGTERREDPKMGSVFEGQPAIWTYPGGIKIDATNVDAARLRAAVRPEQRAMLPKDRPIDKSDALHAHVEIGQLLKAGAKLAPDAQDDAFISGGLVCDRPDPTMGAAQWPAGDPADDLLRDPQMAGVIRGQSASDPVQVGSEAEEYAWLESTFGHGQWLWLGSHRVRKYGNELDRIDVEQYASQADPSSIIQRSYYFQVMANPLDPVMSGTGDSAGGRLLAAIKAGTIAPITWVDIPGPDGMTITVATDNLKAPLDGMLRAPISWTETIAASKELTNQLGFGVIAPSKRIVDAIYAAAPIKTVFNSLVQKADDSKYMGTIGFSRRYNDDIDTQIAKANGGDYAFVSGHEKYWLLDPRLDKDLNTATLARSHIDPPPGEPAINYGGWSSARKPIQSIGGRHNDAHFDYSQLFRPVKRYARAANGSTVDLLAWIRDNEGVPARFTEAFDFGGGATDALASLARDIGKSAVGG